YSDMDTTPLRVVGFPIRKSPDQSLLKKSEFEKNKNFKLKIRHIEGNSGDALKDHELSFNIKR
ncbi:hypothetical protein ACI0FQ_18385, partial [Bacillus velezensis]|uniref:hypothetical protein n=1 Tax=Bacillus velezensis TaxID=492670 RepID=UPI00384D01D2